VVLDRPVVDILWIRSVKPTEMVVPMKPNTDFIGEYERPKEDTLASPFRGLDEKVVLCSRDVYQADQYCGDLHFGTANHV